MSNATDIFSEFQPISKSDWLAKIEKDLKGNQLSELQSRIGQIIIDPFPHRDDLKLLKEPFSGVAWEVGEDIDATDVLKANRLAKDALRNGVQALRFVLSENLGDHRMESMLEGIELQEVSIHFYEVNRNAAPLKLLQHFFHCVQAAKLDNSKLRGSVHWTYPNAVVPEDLGFLLDYSDLKLPSFKLFTVNGQDFFRDVDGVVDELCCMIKAGNQFIETLTGLGYSIEKASDKIQFSVLVGTNYFVEIAKIRALKILWANVRKAWGEDKAKLPVIEAHFAVSEQKEDAYQNMIQATTQAMSAITGGVTRLTVMPAGVETEKLVFYRRIARNVQHILKLESHLDWVKDPAAGSYFIETLTTDLAKAAWKKFQQQN